VTVADLDLDLDIFVGPFDLLMAVVLREEVSLLDLQLGEVVVAYVEELERKGELELEVATEFLVLIAALLELKSRLMLPRADDEALDQPFLGRALGNTHERPPLPAEQGRVPDRADRKHDQRTDERPVVGTRSGQRRVGVSGHG